MIAPSGEVQLQFRQDASAPYDYLSYRTSEGGEYRLYGDGPESAYLVHVYREDSDALTVDLLARLRPALDRAGRRLFFIAAPRTLRRAGAPS